MSGLKNIFTSLNLSAEHAKVYLANLEIGPAPAAMIAKKAKLPRSTVYGLLEHLIKLGLISMIEGESKKMFSPAPPETLQDLIAQKEKALRQDFLELTTQMSRLQALYQSHQFAFPKVSFFQGETGLKTVYYDTLAASEILIVCQGSSAVQTSLADDPQYLKDFICECTLRKIPTRELLQNTPAVREYQEKYASRTHQIIVTPANSPGSFGHVDKHIYDGKIAFIAHDNLVGVTIEDETLFQSEKALFEILWEYHQSRKS